MQRFTEEWLEIKNEFGVFKEEGNQVQGIHNHEFLEMIYVLSGSVVQKINGKTYNMKKGSMLFINYEQEHSFFADDNYTYVNFMLKPSFISKSLLTDKNSFELLSLSLFDEFKDKVEQFSPVVEFSGSELINIERIIDLMLSEYEERRSGFTAVLESCMRVIMALFVRKMCNEEYNQIVHYVSKITPEILKYIDDNCFEKLSMKELAEKCFYTPSYFSKMFKQSYGMSPKSYVKKKRINKAIFLLETTNDPIESICHSVGYSDKKQFYSVFKEITGKLPGDIRKK